VAGENERISLPDAQLMVQRKDEVFQRRCFFLVNAVAAVRAGEEGAVMAQVLLLVRQEARNVDEKVRREEQAVLPLQVKDEPRRADGI
jgi:hypothetical protein